jgi:hypothetical protein
LSAPSPICFSPKVVSQPPLRRLGGIFIIKGLGSNAKRLSQIDLLYLGKSNHIKRICGGSKVRCFFVDDHRFA